MNMTETHAYDGKLRKDMSIELSDELLNITEISLESKCLVFIQLKKILEKRNNFKNNAVKYFDAIANDCKGNRSNNYDASNNLYADDLLYICAKHLLNTLNSGDILDILIVQLQEISLGSCPQGRTHRLLQIVNIIIDFRNIDINQNSEIENDFLYSSTETSINLLKDWKRIDWSSKLNFESSLENKENL
jgi:hypothetical protein